jgi:hypothetical protein
MLKENNKISEKDYIFLTTVNGSLYETYKQVGVITTYENLDYFTPITSKENIINYDPKLYELIGLPTSFKNSSELVTDGLYIPEAKRPLGYFILTKAIKIKNLENNNDLIENNIRGMENLEILKNKIYTQIKDPNIPSIHDAKIFYKFPKYYSLLLSDNIEPPTNNTPILLKKVGLE